MKRGKKNLTSSRRSAGAALERVLRGDELVLIPALVLLYLAGRVSFAAAYARGAAARAFGMARSPAPPPWRPRLPYSWRVDAL